MANTTAAPGAPPAPQGLVARFLGIIASPRETFQVVAAYPKWFGMLALTMTIVAVCSALPLTTDEGREAALEVQVSQMESFGMKVDDAMYEQMRGRMAFAPYTTAGFVIIIAPIVTVIIAAVFFAIFNAAMGGEASFKQVYAVVVHAGVISALQQLFTGPLNYFRGTMTSATNLAVLLPMIDEKSFAGHLLGAIDLFMIWYVMVLAIGLGVLYRRRTRPIAIGLFAVYAVIAIVIALVKSQLGGA
jgi:Yip1-like protein